MAQNTATGGQQPARPQVRGLVHNEGLTRETTKYMFGTLEWTGLIFQVVVLLGSVVLDPYIYGGKTIILCLAAAHLALMPLYYRGYGPFTRGGWWVMLCVGQGLSVNVLQALLSQPRTYGDHLSCVPGCNYSAPTWLFMAFYPWLPPTLSRFREPFEWALLSVYYVFFLA